MTHSNRISGTIHCPAVGFGAGSPAHRAIGGAPLDHYDPVSALGHNPLRLSPDRTNSWLNRSYGLEALHPESAPFDRMRILGSMPLPVVRRELRQILFTADRSLPCDAAIVSGIHLLRDSGVLSLKAASHFEDELPRPFLTQLFNILTRNRLSSYSEIAISNHGSEDSILLRYLDRRAMTLVRFENHLAIVDGEDYTKLALGEKRGIFNPRMRMITVDENGAIVPSVQSRCDELPEQQTIDGSIVRYRASSASIRAGLLSYTHLRRAIYQQMAQERFRDAARMLELIPNSDVVVQIFKDLMSGTGIIDSQIANAAAMRDDLCAYVGMLLAEMEPRAAASCIYTLMQDCKRSERNRLEGWILAIFDQIRPQEVMAEPSNQGALPRLSQILGVLIESRESRTNGLRLMARGLTHDNVLYGDHLAQALRHIANRHAEFRDPTEAIEAEDITRLYVERVSLAQSVRRLIGSDSNANFPQLGGRLIEVEAAAQELTNRLAVALRGMNGNDIEVVASSILFGLPPEQSLRIAANVALQHDELGQADVIAQLLSTQQPDGIMTYLREIAPFCNIGMITDTIIALWNRGERGEMLFSETVRRALDDDRATDIFQRALQESGGISSLVPLQLEIYQGLQEEGRLGELINPTDTFLTTGILRPQDLDGRHRSVAIAATLEKLKELDENSASPPGLRLEEFEEFMVRRKQICDLLVRLHADSPEVVKYLVSKLSTPDNVMTRRRDLDAGFNIGRLALTRDRRRYIFTHRDSLYIDTLNLLSGQRSTKALRAYYEGIIKASPGGGQMRIELSDIMMLEFPEGSTDLNSALAQIMIDEMGKQSEKYMKVVKRTGDIAEIEAEDNQSKILTAIVRMGNGIVPWLKSASESDRSLIPLIVHAAVLIKTVKSFDLIREICRSINGDEFSLESQRLSLVMIKTLDRLDTRYGAAAPIAYELYALHLYRSAIAARRARVRKEFEESDANVKWIVTAMKKRGLEGVDAVVRFMDDDRNTDGRAKLRILEAMYASSPFRVVDISGITFEWDGTSFLLNVLARISNPEMFLNVVRRFASDDDDHGFGKFGRNLFRPYGQFSEIDRVRTLLVLQRLASDDGNPLRQNAAATLLWIESHFPLECPVTPSPSTSWL